MTVENFYEYIRGDYVGTKARLMTDERILRFVNKFPADAIGCFWTVLLRPTLKKPSARRTL